MRGSKARGTGAVGVEMGNLLGHQRPSESVGAGCCARQGLEGLGLQLQGAELPRCTSLADLQVRNKHNGQLLVLKVIQFDVSSDVIRKQVRTRVQGLAMGLAMGAGWTGRGCAAATGQGSWAGRARCVLTSHARHSFPPLSAWSAVPGSLVLPTGDDRAAHAVRRQPQPRGPVLPSLL